MGHFYFVRHGQTVWNVEGKICGRTDSELTEYGHQQAVRQAGNFWKKASGRMKSCIRRLSGQQRQHGIFLKSWGFRQRQNRG